MLVLSRSESEKVHFPSLGISVEVTRVKGKTVRLGIDAPREIRVVRGEVDKSYSVSSPKLAKPTNANLTIPDPKTDQEPARSCSGVEAISSAGKIDASEIRKCLESAMLAIHLAQNQIQQELRGRAEDALEHALACLQELDFAIGDHDLSLIHI